VGDSTLQLMQSLDCSSHVGQSLGAFGDDACHGTRPAMVDVPGGTVRAAAAAWGVSKTTAAKWIALGRPPLGA